MNIILIQPSTQPEAIDSVYVSPHESAPFSPNWEMLCLQGYILRHTGLFAKYIDTRLFSNLQPELINAIKGSQPVKFAVVNATSNTLGSAAAVLDIIKRQHPEIKTVLCGQFPSQFPGKAAKIPRADFSLSGDPEPILHSLIKHINFPQRLHRIPGLVSSNSDKVVKPQWLKSLNTLPLDEDASSGVYWPAYTDEDGKTTMEMRISRGNSKTAADRAFGSANEPLRLRDFHKMAELLESTVRNGVTEVCLSDPPGIWTPDRIRNWCSALRSVRNYQRWRISVLPHDFSMHIIDLMAAAKCQGIDLILPSCRLKSLEKFGCHTDKRKLVDLVDYLRFKGISPRLRIWIGGPEEPAGEARKITDCISLLGYPDYLIHNYPFYIDSKLYQEIRQTHNALPVLDDWMEWSTNPWLVRQPCALWRGIESVDDITKDAQSIHRSVKRSTRRLLQNAFIDLKSNSLVKSVGVTLKALIRPPSLSVDS